MGGLRGYPAFEVDSWNRSISHRGGLHDSSRMVAKTGRRGAIMHPLVHDIWRILVGCTSIDIILVYHEANSIIDWVTNFIA